MARGSKRALITAITGQDGATLAEILLEKGYEVHGLREYIAVHDTGRIEDLKDIKLHYGDLSDAGNLVRVIGKVEPHEIYNLAKIAGLKMCQAYRKQYGCDFIAAMPTNLYGPGDYYDIENAHVIPSLILKMHEAKEKGDSQVTLWGTGSPLREFLYVDDLADGLVRILMAYSDPEPVNIGSGEEISIADLAALIQSTVGYEGDIIFDPRKPDGTPRKFVDGSKMQTLGWKALTPLEKGLRQTYAAFLSSRIDVNPSIAALG